MVFAIFTQLRMFTRLGHALLKQAATVNLFL